MKYFRIKYADGRIETLKAPTALALIQHYDFATKEHVNTRIVELSGEQEAIARSNEQVGSMGHGAHGNGGGRKMELFEQRDLYGTIVDRFYHGEPVVGALPLIGYEGLKVGQVRDFTGETVIVRVE